MTPRPSLGVAAAGTRGHYDRIGRGWLLQRWIHSRATKTPLTASRARRQHRNGIGFERCEQWLQHERGGAGSGAVAAPAPMGSNGLDGQWAFKFFF